MEEMKIAQFLKIHNFLHFHLIESIYMDSVFYALKVS